MAKFGKFLFGFMLGAFIGAGASILLAPYSGNQLRLEVKQYFDNAAQDIRTAATQKREELEIQLEQLRAPKISDESE